MPTVPRGNTNAPTIAVGGEGRGPDPRPWPADQGTLPVPTTSGSPVPAWPQPTSSSTGTTATRSRPTASPGAKGVRPRRAHSRRIGAPPRAGNGCLRVAGGGPAVAARGRLCRPRSDRGRCRRWDPRGSSGLDASGGGGRRGAAGGAEAVREPLDPVRGRARAFFAASDASSIAALAAAVTSKWGPAGRSAASVDVSVFRHEGGGGPTGNGGSPSVPARPIGRGWIR